MINLKGIVAKLCLMYMFILLIFSYDLLAHSC